MPIRENMRENEREKWEKKKSPTNKQESKRKHTHNDSEVLDRIYEGSDIVMTIQTMHQQTHSSL